MSELESLEEILGFEFNFFVMRIHNIHSLFLISYDYVFLNWRYFCCIRTFAATIWFDILTKQFIVCYVLNLI